MRRRRAPILHDRSTLRELKQITGLVSRLFSRYEISHALRADVRR